ncbi:hypothetical protein CTI12_AA143070 [Artemisia annua]|uniref:Membrane-associated kinase regulator 1 n=1 Tax=Artemisia annua TaxID=35608 RepID=A0A2U1MVE8_ARTAN|nr:hypothetical protein CTI12_AA143070 [Artemisia annua]
MVRTLLLSSSSTSSSATTTTTARHSADSQTSFSTDGCDSSRPSSVTDEELHLQTKLFPSNNYVNVNNQQKKPNKYFSLSRFSSVFRKEIKPANIVTGSSVKRMSTTAKEMIRKYLKKAKPLYEKLSHRQGQAFNAQKMVPSTKSIRSGLNSVENTRNNENDVISHSFSGNLRYPRRRSCVSSCPSSMRSSPSHSGILCKNTVVKGAGIYSSNSSSMEELQSAIQGAIAHCKNSMTQNN